MREPRYVVCYRGFPLRHTLVWRDVLVVVRRLIAQGAVPSRIRVFR